MIKNKIVNFFRRRRYIINYSGRMNLLRLVTEEELGKAILSQRDRFKNIGN